MDAISRRVPTGGFITQNQVETGSGADDLLSGIANIVSGGAQAEDASIEETSSGESQSTSIPDIDLSNNQNDPSGGTSGSVADDVMAGIAAALTGRTPGQEISSEVSPTEEIPDSGSPLGDITNMPDLSNDQND